MNTSLPWNIHKVETVQISLILYVIIISSNNSSSGSSSGSSHMICVDKRL